MHTSGGGGTKFGSGDVCQEIKLPIRCYRMTHCNIAEGCAAFMSRTVETWVSRLGMPAINLAMAPCLATPIASLTCWFTIARTHLCGNQSSTWLKWRPQNPQGTIGIVMVFVASDGRSSCDAHMLRRETDHQRNVLASVLVGGVGCL